MKNICLSLLVAGAITSAFANWGVEAGVKSASGSEEKILGVQPISELVGDGGTETYIEVYKRWNAPQIGVRFTAGDDMYKAELATKLHMLESDHFGTYLSFGFGLGQYEGGTKTISTNVTRQGYVTQAPGASFANRTTVKMEDAQFVTFSAGIGASYKFTKSLALNVGYEYERRSLEIDYSFGGNRVESSGINQDFHGVRAGLSYTF